MYLVSFFNWALEINKEPPAVSPQFTLTFYGLDSKIELKDSLLFSKDGINIYSTLTSDEK